MIADSADIKFACSQCGQRIVVEKSAAGLTANCPICEGLVTVPHVSSLREHRPRQGAERSESGRGKFSDPGLEETRQELFSAAADHGKVQRELDDAKKEVERFRSLFKKAVDECERMTANATHAQAEIKSFQSDRQQLKTELSQSRQRAQIAESQLAESVEALAAAKQENTALREQIDQNLTLSQERLAATETQLTVRERELLNLQAENSEVVQSLAGAQAELAATRIELNNLRGEWESARQALNKAAESEQSLVAAKRELQTRFDEATAETQRLIQEREQLHQQAELLRRDLVGIDSGRELLELRDQVRALADAQAQTTAALVEKASEAQSLAAAEQKLRAELQEVRQLREEAEQRAAANSEAQLKKDNDILRGIVARQNTTLGAHFSELRRLRRGRFGLRIVYTIFGLGLLALIFFAVSIFSHHGAGGIFQQLHR